MIKYPIEDEIIEYNALAITIFDVKKADKVEILSYSKLSQAIERCKITKGDIYNKATVLLISLVRSHAFASGNRRTAIITTINFLNKNGSKFKVKDDPKNAGVLTGIREGYYSTREVKEWIKNGKIRKFKR